MLKTLSYDCGNPVQFVCGHSPAHFLCHSRAGGNRAWFVISYLILGIILCCVFINSKSVAQFNRPYSRLRGNDKLRN